MQEVVVETGAPATLNYVSSSFVHGTSSLCVCARLPLQPAVQVDPSTHAKDLPHSRCYTTGAVATIWRVSSAAFVSPSSPTCQQAYGHISWHEFHNSAIGTRQPHSHSPKLDIVFARSPCFKVLARRPSRSHAQPQPPLGHAACSPCLQVQSNPLLPYHTYTGL